MSDSAIGGKEPGSEVFSEADLAPPDWLVRARRSARIDRAAAAAAVLALGLWLGGLCALGACAAPLVFALTPYPFSADAMGAVFARFDHVAMGCAVALLAAELVRTLIDMRRPPPAPRWIARARRLLGMGLALLGAYSATQLTPAILALHRAGARRQVGQAGALLERLHQRAERVGKTTVPLLALLIALHVATVRSANDDEDDAPAPLPPGKR